MRVLKIYDLNTNMWTFIKIAFWTNFWLVVWISIYPFHKKGNYNCLTWALEQFNEKGGYIALRWSRNSRLTWIRWPHFLWMADDKHVHLIHYVPREDLIKMRWIPNPWFDGKIKTGDEKQGTKGEH